jgi:ABC-type transporter Mla MlaB component
VIRNHMWYKGLITNNAMQLSMKKVCLDLTEVDGNAFALLAAFRRQARREGWSAEEIQSVLDEARTGDYGHLVRTLVEHCR